MSALKKSTLEKIGSETNPVSITPEYDIYIFYPQKQPGGPDWERKHTTPCVKQARLHAEELIQTNSYPKVEIRKKYFDARRERKIDCAVKIYGQNAKHKKSEQVAIILVMICAAMVAASIYIFLKP